MDKITKNYLFAYIQIAEIFYVLSFSINFFLYSLSGSLFREQFKNFFKKSNKKLKL
jgi:hypothetical protein